MENDKPIEDFMKYKSQKPAKYRLIPETKALYTIVETSDGSYIKLKNSQESIISKLKETNR